MAKQTKNYNQKNHQKKFSTFMQKKLVLLFMAIILAFVILVLRITYINASNGSSYTKVVLDQQQYNSRIIPFKRDEDRDKRAGV